jgi:hypothetical protein
VGTYVYAITTADHPLHLEGLHGVGEPAASLRTVGTGTLSAVISDAPENLRAKRRDLAAHQAVLERLMVDGPVLPMRFGLVGSDDESVTAALVEHRDAYTERLARVDGCVEFNLKVSRAEDDLLREIVQEAEQPEQADGTGDFAEAAEVRRLRRVTRDDPGAQREKVRLGELISSEVRLRQEREGAELVSRLADGTVDQSLAEPTSAHFLNVSFLVRRADAPSFTEAVQEETERHGDAYSLDLHGPLPPYSFV